MLAGTFLVGYGLSRFFVELFRQPDFGLENLSWGLTMGQTLTVPMIVGGAYLIARAARIQPERADDSDAELRARVNSRRAESPQRTRPAALPWAQADKS